MSRKSQAFAEGQPAFSWRVERIAADRFKVSCKNHPEVVTFGDTEQKAIRAATKAITEAAEKGDLGMVGPGQYLDQAK